MQTVLDIFNSAFVISLAGAALGAFAGAYGGQRIVERGKLRGELLQEIRNTNAATMLAFTICNAAIGVKGQHVKNLTENFERDRTAAIAFLAKTKEGKRRPDEIFEFRADFRTLPSLDGPIGLLQWQVYDKISITGRPLAAVSVLATTIADLNSIIEHRNRLIASYRATSAETSTAAIMPLYFGLPLPGGHLDETYPDLMAAIRSKTDDAIFFSKLVGLDLFTHATNTRDQFKKRFGQRQTIAVSKPDFSVVEKGGLMPDEAEYADWTKAFVPSVS